MSRQEYRPVAKRGAILYFVISELSAINSMYEYSLGAFLQDVFGYSIRKSEPSFEIPVRLGNIITTLTYNLYAYVCMGIFEKHKLMLSFQMVIRLLSNTGDLNTEELEFFLRGCVLTSKDFPPNPTNYLTPRQWNDVCKLSTTCSVYEQLADQITANTDEWFKWINHDKPEDVNVEIPCGYREKTTEFQRLCLLRCFRSDRVYIAVPAAYG